MLTPSLSTQMISPSRTAFLTGSFARVPQSDLKLLKTFPRRETRLHSSSETYAHVLIAIVLQFENPIGVIEWFWPPDECERLNCGETFHPSFTAL